MNEPAIRLPAGTHQLLWAVCHDCGKKHPIELKPGIQDNQLTDWWVKHEGHRIEYRQEDPLSLFRTHSEKRNPWNLVKGWFRRLSRLSFDCRFALSQPYLNYDPNTDDKIAYGSSAALTITLASLATSSTLVAGRESTAIVNTTNLYYDYQFGGFVTVGTTPTINTTVEMWSYASQDDTPTYPSLVTSGITGTDAAAVAATAGIKANALTPITSLAVDATTSNRQYNVAPLFLFGGCSPKRWGVWATHSTAVNFNATGGNFVLSYLGQYGTS